MAKQAQVSDWITNTRTLYKDTLAMFVRYQALAHEAMLTGRVVIGAEGVTTNLLPENFVGENENLDIQVFVNAFAVLGMAFSGVTDENTALLYEVKS